ncbi:hypothetical protein GLOIN_2v1692780 [Rhizophagus irregularis DAOM 181602=DAOM 197198]|nr:hypothetical protein GLOIN_2v1692780 [Rhizophagus irregularis DAOM 181602=DAOM 197198]
MTRKFSSIEDLDLLLLKIFLFRHILKYTENQTLHLESFGSEFFHYNTFQMNNSIFGVKERTKNKIEFLFKPLLRLNNQNAEFNCLVMPADPSIKEIMIKYTIPVKLSTVNVSIFQLNDDLDKPDLLRQTFSGDSKLCTIGSDNYTVHIPIFESTFNQQNSTYYVFVENNFVISQERDEPLFGIKGKIWMFLTKPLKMAQHSDSVTGLLRLNEGGSLKFLQMNHSIFFKNMIQKFFKIIPVTESTSGKWKYDPISIQDFADLAFILLKVKNTSYLIISTISKKIMLWDSIINIFIEDISQIIIQELYYNSVITYDLIPSLALASGELVIDL